MQKPRIRAAFRLKNHLLTSGTCRIGNVRSQKSEAMPLFSQSP
jgi:hypothetical protein